MVVTIYWAMLLLGWTIAIWALGVITVLYCCRGECVRARSASARNLSPPPDLEDSYVGTMKRRKQILVETVYITQAPRVFHTHACGRNRDIAAMTKLDICKFCRGQLLR